MKNFSPTRFSIFLIWFVFSIITSCSKFEDTLEPQLSTKSGSLNLSSVGALPRVSLSNGDFIMNDSIWNPAGMNYTQVMDIGWNQYDSQGNYLGSSIHTTHKTLLVPSFNINSISAAFSSIKNDGYNFVRIMINFEGEGTDSGTTYYGIAGPYNVGSNHKYGLYIPYMDNFINLLTAANEAGLYVLPCLDYLPYNSYYQSNLTQPVDGNGEYYIENVNLYYMHQVFIDNKVNYIKNFIKYIKDANPDLLSTVLSYDFNNEVNVIPSAAPFTRTDNVLTADGLSYNMSSDADRQQCVDANIVNWSNQCMNAVLAEDALGNGNCSVFTFNAVGYTGPNGVHSTGNDTRYPARPATLSLYSNIKFMDIHLYPNGGSYSADSDLNSSEYNLINKTRTPLILGEFGAFRTVFFQYLRCGVRNERFKELLQKLQKALKDGHFGRGTQIKQSFITQQKILVQ